MKRFINIGDQVEEDSEQFAFYCTVKDAFEVFDSKSIWSNSLDFQKDYNESGGDELDRYLGLIPDEFKSPEKLEYTFEEMKVMREGKEISASISLKIKG